jgi:hypothetical protein
MNNKILIYLRLLTIFQALMHSMELLITLRTPILVIWDPRIGRRKRKLMLRKCKLVLRKRELVSRTLYPRTLIKTCPRMTSILRVWTLTWEPWAGRTRTWMNFNKWHTLKMPRT